MNEAVNAEMNDVMMDHVVNTSVEWSAWQLAKNIQNKFGKIESANGSKMGKKKTRRKRKGDARLNK
jgi:hypothetical protein